MQKVSAVIVSYNEASKLVGCLESLGRFIDEIVVVDMESQDNTASVVKQFAGRLIHTPRVLYVEKVRNFAIKQAKNDWVLVMDPDERLSGQLKQDLLNELKTHPDVAGFNIPRKNVFFGRWIAHSNFWPDRHIRLFQKTLVDWPSRIHTYPKVNGQIISLPANAGSAIIHYGYDNVRNFFARQRRYAKAEGENNLEQGKKFSLFRLFWMPAREILVRLVKHQGYLDGWYGIILVAGLVYYRILAEIELLRWKR